jgi:hypothetical protein
MADLTIAPATGSQVTTQNPQTVPTGQSVGGASTKSGGVQPGTARSVLTSQNGLSLGNSALTTVNLATGEASGTQAESKAVAQQPAAHHVNGALVGISIVLILVAIVLFWAIGRSAKSTTNYS